MTFERLILVVATIPALAGCLRARTVEELVPEDLRGNTKLVSIARAIESGYGKDFGGVSKNGAGEIVFLFVGKEVIYDDGKKKNLNEMLSLPDLEDSFSMTYPLTNPTDKVPVDFDPGRVRTEEMFKALYGATKEEVAKSCVMVSFCGHRVLFSARCGAALALEAVGKDLEALFASRPDLRDYVSELGGTFAWRNIAGTNRLSNHSFGNAIDLNVKKSAYWRWSPASTLESFSRTDWPAGIIEAFEKHGFIWGGKWWHYDTMHFEFRPELIAHAKLQ